MPANGRRAAPHRNRTRLDQHWRPPGWDRHAGRGWLARGRDGRLSRAASPRKDASVAARELADELRPRAAAHPARRAAAARGKRICSSLGLGQIGPGCCDTLLDQMFDKVSCKRADRLGDGTVLAQGPFSVRFSVRGRCTLERSELALLTMSQLAAGLGEPYPLDRIRVQKAVFLLTKRGSLAWRNLYAYRPYNWGPYSSQLSSDTDALVRAGLLEDVPGARYGQYRATPRGEALAAQAWAALSSQEQSFIRTVRAYVTSRSFTQLLREVYAAYPDFATASQFSG